jgi:excisionase family DNA binding protein
VSTVEFGQEVMTALEAAAFLSSHVETLRRLARRGEIPSFKVGKDWRFRRSALEQWLSARGSCGSVATVLIVDDEPGVCRALGRMVGELGHRTLEATDARVGLALALGETPDLVLLDLKMPNLNGPQFLAQLRQTHPDLPVVIVTAYPDSALMQAASRHAPLLLLAKPVERELLQRTVRAVLQDASARLARRDPIHEAASA